ncbi:C-type lectin domain family 4 member E-like isoform X6 [Alosa sapidissima]|uniref:C-type lectin domain family 4 member E-like isoform X6 n=1 Tax=Alosa sapidissima TaxID=34773 RepID=UPI001C08F3DD|nr:C-type lectin domain family 4 member E-like isoform X6 [Alosa sapidissima]
MAESVVYSEVKYKKESNADTGRAGPQIKESPEDDVVYAAVVHKADHTNQPNPPTLPTPADSSPKGSKGIRRHSLLLLAVVVLCILILGTVISLSLYSGCKPGKCNDGWEAHGRQCYFFSTKKKSLNWTQSQEECVHKKSHLAIINDKKEQKLLMMIIRQKMQGPEDKFWIGLNDRQMEGKWLWVDNTPLNTSQKFWLNNEPDNWKWVNNTEYPDGEDCVRMGENNFIANSAAGWVDTACEREFKFICETKACL